MHKSRKRHQNFNKTSHKISRMSNLRRTIKRLIAKTKYRIKAAMMSYCAKHCEASGVTRERIADAEVIVSLTTFGKRLQEVHLAIESIMQGKVKPNRIMLWISEDYKDTVLPQPLQRQQARGLEVMFCKDIRSYTKLVPALRQYADSVIVTIDDDNIYRPELLRNLLAAHAETPDEIIANRVHRVRKNADGTMKSYSEWAWESSIEDASYLNFLTGVGGVLYPKRCFCDEVLNENVFLDICKYADDVWFYAMAIKSGRLIRKIHTISKGGCEYLENPDVQDVGLFHTNLETAQNSNDVQLKAVFEKYNLHV